MPDTATSTLVDCVDFEELLLLFELLEKVSADAVPIRLIDINRVSGMVSFFIYLLIFSSDINIPSTYVYSVQPISFPFSSI